ncbi:MAG: acyl carrier protein, partial [Ruminiclostridium sp.]
LNDARCMCDNFVLGKLCLNLGDHWEKLTISKKSLVSTYIDRDKLVIMNLDSELGLKLSNENISISYIEQAYINHPNVHKAIASYVDDGTRLNIDLFVYDNLKKYDYWTFVKDVLPTYCHNSIINEYVQKGLYQVSTSSIALPVYDIEINESLVLDVECKLITCLRTILETEDINSELDIFEIGANSISVVRFIEIINNKYSLKLTANLIYENPKIGKLAEKLVEAM